MNKVTLTKEIFQELLKDTEGSFAKDMNRCLKENKFVEVFCDKVSPLVIVFSDSSEGTVEFSQKHGHYVAKESYIRPISVKQDLYELEDESYIIIPCDELIAPEYTPIIVKDVLNLPRKETNLCIVNLLENILDKSSMDFVGDYYNLEENNTTVSKLMHYSQGYSGKYGLEVHVITFKGEDVALVRCHGKWTDDYTITPISDSYSEMCNYLENLYVDKQYDEKPLSLEDEYWMDNILEEMFLNKEYTKHEGE